MPLKAPLSYQMSNSHVVQILPALLIEFPYYCIISLKLALGYVVCCVNIHFIILANPPLPPLHPHGSTPHLVSTCLSSLDVIS